MTVFHANHVRAALSLATLCLLAGVATARAADIETQSVSVDLAGVDLTSPAGRALAHRKVSVAAREVCGGWESPSLADKRDAKACRTHAMEDATARVNALADAESHGTRFGAAQPVAVASK